MNNINLNLVIEKLQLSKFQQHVVMIWTADFCRLEKDASMMSELYKEFYIDEEKGETSTLIKAWVEEYTPLIFNPKKKRFSLGRSNKWRIEDGLSDCYIMGEDSYNDFSRKYKFYSLEGIKNKSVLDRVTNRFNDIEKGLNGEISPKITKNKNRNNKNRKNRKTKANDEIDFEPEDETSSNQRIKKYSDESKRDRDLIREFLKNNPAPEAIGKFGIPQSKYRHGTYGLNSMEYDIWRK